jgi:hypothetical protein
MVPVRSARPRWWLPALLLALLAGESAAQPTFTDIDVILIAEVADRAGWLGLHQEVLSTPGNSARSLRVSLPAGTGGNRSVNIEQPKFLVTVLPTLRHGPVKVTVTGKVLAAEALAVLTPFEHAALEVQAGAIENELTLLYGLSSVVGRLIELHLQRP